MHIFYRVLIPVIGLTASALAIGLPSCYVKLCCSPIRKKKFFAELYVPPNEDLTNFIPDPASRWPSSRSLPGISQSGIPLPPPPRPEQQLLNVTAVAEHNVHLNCIASDTKDMEKLEWRRDNQLLPANHRQYVFPNGTLLIQKVDGRLDSGSYVCKKGSGQQVEYRLLIIIPPRIDPLAFPLDLSPGVRVRVSCLVSRGDPPIKIHWFKDGQSLMGNAREDIAVQDIDQYASFLAIESLNVHHAGNYTCLASNHVAQDVKTARLTVNVPVYWVQEPSDAIALFRTDTTMSCQANGTPRPVIEWKKSIADSLGNYTPVASSRHHIFDNGTLSIRDLERIDQGSYLCQATNGIGPAISKVVHLAVKSPVHFLLNHETFPASLGYTATLECHTYGDHPIIISWYHRDSEIKHGHYDRLTVQTLNTPDGIKSSLSIRDTARSDSGDYICKVSNEYGSAKKILKLLVQEVPEAPSKISVIATNSRMAQIGWTAGYDGNSPIINFILEWKRPAELWTDDGMKREYTPGNGTAYTLKNLKPANRYDIRVRASNTLGQSEPSQLVQILCDEEAPSEIPVDLIATSSSSTTINLTWKPPTPEGHNGLLQGYIVGYKVENSSDAFVYKTVKSNGKRDESVLLRDLRKFTSYTIIVQAYNAMGTGPKAEIAGLWTMEDVPSEAPHGIVATAVSAQRISVIWEQLPQESINGVLLGYKVLYKPLADWTSQPDVKVVYATSCDLDGLKKFTNYTVHVVAFTKAGDGMISSAIHAQTLPDVPSVPDQIKALVKSPNSVLVTWTDPVEKNGMIKQFNVYIKSSSAKREKKRVVYPDGFLHKYEFNDLTINEVYEFWVTAETDVGEGAPSDRVKASPASTGPARVASFPVTISGPLGSIAILPCIAVGFPAPSIEWFRGNYPMSEVLTNGSLIIKNLKASNEGNYTCKARNLYDTEFLDVGLRVQQPPQSPAVLVSSSTSNTLTVEWKVVNDGGSTVKGFTLYYRPDNDGWKSIRLPANYDRYTLQYLFCGHTYHIYMTTYNDIGTSDASPWITSATAGHAPVAPDIKAFLEPNSTSVLTFLAAWHNGGCSIKSFSMKYQAYHDSAEWKTVSEAIPGDAESVTVEDLLPETVYRMKVSATNDAGTTEKEYTFGTRTEDGDMILPEVVLQKEHSILAFHEDTTKMLPLSIGVLVCIFAVVALIMLVRRRKQRKYPSADLDSTNLRDLTTKGFRVNEYIDRTPRKTDPLNSPWRNISHYAAQNNHSPVSLASTPKQWQPPTRNNDYMFSSPKKVNLPGRPRDVIAFSDSHSHYQTPNNRTLKREESTPDSGFSGSNLKHTDCDSFQRESALRLSNGSTSDSDGLAHKLNFNAHKMRPKPAQRRRPPTRPRQGSSSLPRVKASSSSSPSSTEELPYVYPSYCTNRFRNLPEIHFPSPPHSDGDDTSGMAVRPKITVRKDALNKQRYSVNVNALNEYDLDEDLVDVALQPTTTV